MHRILIFTLLSLPVTGCNKSDRENAIVNKIPGLENAEFSQILECQSETPQLIDLGVIHLLLEKDYTGHVVAIWSHSQNLETLSWQRDVVRTDINFIYWQNNRIDQRTFTLQHTLWDSSLTCHIQTAAEFTKEWNTHLTKNIHAE